VRRRRGSALLLAWLWCSTAAGAQSAPTTTLVPREDRVAVGWLIGAGGNDGAGSDGVLEMTVFADLPRRGGRLRLSADLARWGFTSVTYGLANTPGPPFRDTAAVRRIVMQVQRQLPLRADRTWMLYAAPGVAWEFWRFDTNRPDRTTGIAVVGVAGLEYLKPQGRVGLLGEARLVYSFGPTVPGSGPLNLTWLGGVKWRLTRG
jgi:hypothetical protein